MAGEYDEALNNWVKNLADSSPSPGPMPVATPRPPAGPMAGEFSPNKPFTPAKSQLEYNRSVQQSLNAPPPPATTVTVSTAPQQQAPVATETSDPYQQSQMRLVSGGSAGGYAPEHEQKIMLTPRRQEFEQAHTAQLLADAEQEEAQLKESAIMQQIATEKVANAKTQLDQAQIQAQQSQEEELARSKDIEDFSNSIQDTKSLYNQANAMGFTGALFGQMAAGLAQIGGNPQAMQSVANLNNAFDKHMEREIDKQERLYKMNLAGKESAYSRAMARYGSPEAARNILRAANNQYAATQFEQMAARAKDPQVQAAASNLAAQRSQQKAEWDYKTNPFVAAQRTAGSEPMVMVPGMNFPIPLSQAKKLDMRRYEFNENERIKTQGDVLKEGAKNKGELGKDQATRTMELGEGERINFRTQKEYDEAVKKRRGVAEASTQIKRAVSVLKKLGYGDRIVHGSPFPNTKDWNQAESAMGSVVIAAKTASDLGAISGSDAELIKDMVGSIGTQSVNTTIEKLEQYDSDMYAGLQTQLRANEGYVPAPPKTATPGWK